MGAKGSLSHSGPSMSRHVWAHPTVPQTRTNQAVRPDQLGAGGSTAAVTCKSTPYASEKIAVTSAFSALPRSDLEIGPGGIHAALCIAVQLHDTSAVRALGVPRLPLKMASQRERPEVSRAEVEASAGMGAELRVLVVRTRTRTHHFCT